MYCNYQWQNLELGMLSIFCQSDSELVSNSVIKPNTGINTIYWY